MLRIGQVENTKSMDDLITSATSASLTGRPILDFENLDCKPIRKIPAGNFQKQVTTAKEMLNQRNDHLQTNSFAWMIYEIWDFKDLSTVQLKNDNIQAFDTKWEQVFSAVTDRTYRQHLGESVQDAS